LPFLSYKQKKNRIEMMRHKIVVCAIVKNEAPYLLEWIAYHRVIGVDGFLIYNNDSTDETPRILEQLARAGIITYIEWPSQPDRNNQEDAYRDACQRLAGQSEWVAFIDADEFIVPVQHDDLPSFLAEYVDVSGIAINWKLFGSSGHLVRSEGLVIEQFTQASRSKSPQNTHFKTIARIDFVRDLTVHRCKFSDGDIYCYPDRTPVSDQPQKLITYINHQFIQINHYFTKSKAEWSLKRARGRATKTEEIRSENFFYRNDMNDEYDLKILRFLEKTKQEISTLSDLSNTQVLLETDLKKVRFYGKVSFAKQTKSQILGSIVNSPQLKSESEANKIKILGWVLGKTLPAIAVEVICQGKVLLKVPVSQARPKIAEKYPEKNYARNCGFSGSISLIGMPTQSDILIQAVLEDNSCVPIGLIQYCQLSDEIKQTDKLVNSEEKMKNFTIAKNPLLSNNAINFLKNYFVQNSNSKVLEFGSGASTVWLSRLTSNLVSIKHHPDWYETVKSTLDNDSTCQSVDLRLLPLPYYSVCDEFPDEYFDLIIVDGRDRMKCLEASIRILKPGGILMLDDAQRKRYERADYLLRDWEFTRSISPARQTHWWIKPEKFTTPDLKWTQLLAKQSLRLYAGNLTPYAKKEGWIGVSHRMSDEYHINHDLTNPFPIPDDTIDAFQSEDVFEHIPPDRLISVTFPEMYRTLKPGGYIRISVPDYRCDVLLNRTWKDERGKPYYDPGLRGQGKVGAVDKTVMHRGHIWFPTYEQLWTLIELSPLRYCRADWLHYYDSNGEPIMNEIDYSKGYVKRTPDNDKRVKDPRRPLSIVVDLYK